MTAFKCCCLCSDRLLSAVVDGTQLKLQRQMEKHYREACKATLHAPCLCAAAAYIYGDVLKVEGHIYLLLKHILGNQEREAHSFPTLHLGEFWTVHTHSLPFPLHLSFPFVFPLLNSVWHLWAATCTADLCLLGAKDSLTLKDVWHGVVLHHRLLQFALLSHSTDVIWHSYLPHTLQNGWSCYHSAGGIQEE